MQVLKRVIVISCKVGLWLVAWPVMVGIKLSKLVHRRIEMPVLRYLVIGAIMLPSVLVGTAWATAITHPSPVTKTAIQPAAQPAKVTAKAVPRIEKRIVTQTESILFAEQRSDDISLTKGQEVVKQEGKNGLKTMTFEVTYADGKETDRAKTKEEVTTPAVLKLIAVGTKTSTTATKLPAATTTKPTVIAPAQTPVAKPASSCDPNYTPCVPIASDVDCLGGGGNGPAYVKGPVKVIGVDIYKLDSNHDGWGCEN